MKTILPLLLAAGLLFAACGSEEPSEPETAAQKGKLRVEYYEISKQ